jgi:hypothetical protein
VNSYFTLEQSHVLLHSGGIVFQSKQPKSIPRSVFMIRRPFLIAPIAIACLFASQAIYASPVNMIAPVNAMFSRTKTVKFQLRNASDSAMDLKAGDTPLTLKAGETMKLELPAGTRIVTITASSTHPAGTLVLEVASMFSGSTVTLH